MQKKSPLKYLGLTDPHPLIQTIDHFLRGLFNGETARFSGRLDPLGTGFQHQVWRAIQTIPLGETRTDGQIANLTDNPKAIRAAGEACGSNPLPLFIPCHRVIAKNELGGFSAETEWKEILLTLENKTL